MVAPAIGLPSSSTRVPVIAAVAAPASRRSGSAAISLRTSLNYDAKSPGEFRVPPLFGDVRGGLAVVALRSAVGAAGEEEVGHGLVASAGRAVQRRVAQLLAGVDVGAVVQQEAHGL